MTVLCIWLVDSSSAHMSLSAPPPFITSNIVEIFINSFSAFLFFVYLKLCKLSVWGIIFSVQKLHISTGPGKKFQDDSALLVIFTISSTHFSRLWSIFSARPQAYWKKFHFPEIYKIQVQYRFQHRCTYVTSIFPETFPENDPHTFWICTGARCGNLKIHRKPFFLFLFFCKEDLTKSWKKNGCAYWILLFNCV